MEALRNVIAILCPGPSLRNVTRADIGDPLEILAINTAIDAPCADGCDWWVVHDLWAEPRPLPNRMPRYGMVTSSAAIREGQSERVKCPLHDFREAMISEPVRITTSAAIYWARWRLQRRAMLDTGRIRLYGCDMKGTSHWDGEENPRWVPNEWDLARACMQKAIAAVGVPVEGLPW